MTFALYRLLYLNAPLNRERQSKDLISLPYLVRFGKLLLFKIAAQDPLPTYPHQRSQHVRVYSA